MQYQLGRAGDEQWLVTRPDTHSFGNAIVNVTWSFLMARERRLPLWMEPLEPERFGALWRLRCTGVRSVADRQPDVASWEPGLQPLMGLNVRRLLAEAPLEVRLSDADERAVAPIAASLGLAGDAPVVALHVRESGYKVAQGAEDRDKDIVRNASLDSYLPAVDWLVSRGYVVARIGDTSMTPLTRPGVVDLATSPERSLALDLFAVQRSAFFIASDSGPYNLSFLFDVPSLLTNVTHFLGAYPLRPADRYIVRHAYDANDGHELALNEMLTPHHLKFRFDTGHVRFGDNTEDEILAGTQEIAAALEHPSDATGAQRDVRNAIETFLASDYGRRKLKLAVTGASEAHYVGEGRATQACAERLAAGQRSPASAVRTA